MTISFKKSFSIALAFCTLLSSAALADPTNDNVDKLATSVYAKKDQNKITVAVKSESASQLLVKIFDASGKHIYTDQIKDSKGFKRTYDLSEAGPGEYTVKVSNESATESKTVSLGETEAKESFKAYFSSYLKDNKIKVSYYNANSPANAIIMDKHGREISRTVISNDKDHATVINLTELNRGDYILRIDSNGQGIEKAISLN